MSDIDTWTNDIHVGDARETLAELPADSVHMVMTSPPYFGLRDYGVDGQVGLEDSLDEYIAELVGVFREVRRVLRPDGAAWLNLGDTFGGDSIVRDEGDWKRPGDDGYEEDHTANYGDGRRGMSDLGRKNKMLVPHRVAIALQEDGWIVRNDCTWVKPNPMPQSVKDRLNTTTEQVFYLRPQPDGWFDLDELCEKPIKATCPPKVCSECGSPYEREVEDNGFAGEAKIQDGERPAADERDVSDSSLLRTNGRTWRDRKHVGWRQTCDCDTDATEAGIALDPFAGAGTTCLVAKNHGRRFIGIDLNPEYVAMAQSRVGVTVDEPERLIQEDATTLAEYTDGGGD